MFFDATKDIGFERTYEIKILKTKNQEAWACLGLTERPWKRRSTNLKDIIKEFDFQSIIVTKN